MKIYIFVKLKKLILMKNFFIFENEKLFSIFNSSLHTFQYPLLPKFCRNYKQTLTHLMLLEFFHLAFYFLDFCHRSPHRSPLKILLQPLPKNFSIPKFLQKLFNLLRAKRYANCLKWLMGCRFISHSILRGPLRGPLLRFRIGYNSQTQNRNPTKLSSIG